MPPKNKGKPSAATGYPQPDTAGYAQPDTAGYAQPDTAGYAQPANAGYPQPANAGYPQPAKAGYPQQAMAGYPYPATAGTYPANTGGGLPTINTTQPGQNVVTVVSETRLGPQPFTVICRSCNQQIVTRIELKPSAKTHLFAVLICLVFWPCVCLPYCVPLCNNIDHYCPNCNAYIGSHNF